MSRIPVDDRHPFAREAMHGFDIELDDNGLDLVVAEEPSKRSSNRAVPDDDGPVTRASA